MNVDDGGVEKLHKQKMVQHLQKVERLYGSSNQKLSKSNSGVRILCVEALWAENILLCGTIGISGHVQQGWSPGELEAGLCFSLNGGIEQGYGKPSSIHLNSKRRPRALLGEALASKEVFQKMSLRSNSYALASVQNPGLSQWCHSYLSYSSPFSPWYCSIFREPTLHGEEAYRQKVYDNIQTQIYPLCTLILWRRV